MASLTADFLASRKKHKQTKRLVLVTVIILLLAGTSTAGFYFYKKDHATTEKIATQKQDQKGQVAATSTTASSVIPPDWLLKYFGTDSVEDPKVGGQDGDPDGDVLTNLQEYYFGTDPTKFDTDGDGEMDMVEIVFAQNPQGQGPMKFDAQQADEYLKSLGPEYEAYTKEGITKKVEEMFDPSRAVVLDLPQDSELVISNQNDVKAFEKYYDETKSLTDSDDEELAYVQANLFDMTAEELNSYINKLQAMIRLLKEVPVPSELVEVHRHKIAGLRAGIRMFELIRDNYRPGGTNEQFWKDYFSQIVVAQQATVVEVLVWAEIAQKLKDQGGLPE